MTCSPKTDPLVIRVDSVFGEHVTVRELRKPDISKDVELNEIKGSLKDGWQWMSVWSTQKKKYTLHSISELPEDYAGENDFTAKLERMLKELLENTEEKLTVESAEEVKG